jgi:hypothetical protein
VELAKDYHAIYSTPHLLADEAKWMMLLQSTVIFLALSAYVNDQQDACCTVSTWIRTWKKKTSRVPVEYNLMMLLFVMRTAMFFITQSLTFILPFHLFYKIQNDRRLLLKKEIINYPMPHQAGWKPCLRLRCVEGGDVLASTGTRN